VTWGKSPLPGEVPAKLANRKLAKEAAGSAMVFSGEVAVNRASMQRPGMALQSSSYMARHHCNRYSNGHYSYHNRKKKL